MKTVRFYRLNFSCHDIPLLFRFLPIEGKRLSIGGHMEQNERKNNETKNQSYCL